MAFAMFPCLNVFSSYFTQHQRMYIFLQALNHIGLRVVLDVVYNHLHENGPFDESSVLDKVMICYQFNMSPVVAQMYS